MVKHNEKVNIDNNLNPNSRGKQILTLFNSTESTWLSLSWCHHVVT
jgi:hypothetical protein